jgi:ProP effector
VSNKPKTNAEQANALIATLAELWPRCFVVLEKHRRPLKTGVHADILAAGQGAVTVDEIKLALRRYCGSIGYLTACTEGADRIDLAGEVAGHVTADEARFATERLAQRKPRQPKPVPAPQAPEPAKRISLGDLRDAARARRDAERGAA